MHNRVYDIDLLRFLAAVAVVFFHYAFRGHAADGMTVMHQPWPWARYGSYGVELFFMISGFVILMTAERSTLTGFVASRVARLYPAFWVCCTLTFVATVLIGAPVYDASWTQYLVNMTMLSDFVDVAPIDGVYWSLSVELRFYLLVGLLLHFRRLGAIETWLRGWLLVAAALELWPIWTLRQIFITPHAAYFIGGATCFLMRARGVSAARLGLFAAALTLALCQALAALPRSSAHYQQAFDPLTVALLIIGMHAMMLLVALGRTGPFGRVDWSLAGSLTYPLYLLHQHVGFMLFNTLHGRVDTDVLFWGTIAAMLGGAYAVHRWVERPFAAPLRCWVSQRLDRRPLPPGAAITAARRASAERSRGDR